MENFLDILTSLIRLLYIYYVRGVVGRPQLMDRLWEYLEIATVGGETSAEGPGGYPYTVYKNLDDDSRYLQEVCGELNYLGHLRAALVIAQTARFVPGQEAKWPRECLPTLREKVRRTIEELGLREPTKQEVVRALDEYKMFSPKTLADLEREIVS